MDIVFIGLSITSSWGNGHATTYRALLRALNKRGHRLLFLERHQPWYAENRDLPRPPYCRVGFYENPADLRARFAHRVRQADLVVVGSFVSDGIGISKWVLETAQGVTAFYDIDTPVTLAALERDACAYLSPALVPAFDLYLSFSGGASLDVLRERFGAKRPRPLYCAVDAQTYRPRTLPTRWDLGYMGTYSADRQPKVEAMLAAPARALADRTFAVAGPQYPDTVKWPANVERFEHLAPGAHPAFYSAQRYTLNITRSDMVALGWSPSVRLFEAAACGAAIISDRWNGIETFFRPGHEILLADGTADVLAILEDMSETERLRICAAGRVRVLEKHTAAERAVRLEAYVAEISNLPAGRVQMAARSLASSNVRAATARP
jgi:spore maturation protein CgeB